MADIAFDTPEDRRLSSASVAPRLARSVAHLRYILRLGAHPDIAIWKQAGDRMVEEALADHHARTLQSTANGG